MFLSRKETFGPLAVFDSYENAELFFYDDNSIIQLGEFPGTYAIFKVEYEPSKDFGLWYFREIFGYREGTYKVVENRKMFRDYCLPEGTVFANKVKLVEKVRQFNSIEDL